MTTIIKFIEHTCMQDLIIHYFQKLSIKMCFCIISNTEGGKGYFRDS